MEDYIRQHFKYNSDGTITRDDRNNSNGSFDKYGYLIIKIKGKPYKAHRLAWFLNYGYFPECEIDHINRIRTDNRIENLRLANRMQNILNCDISVNKDTGKVGIHEDKTTKGLKAKYCFRFKGKTYRFRTIEEAKNKRKELREINYYGYLH